MAAAESKPAGGSSSIREASGVDAGGPGSEARPAAPKPVVKRLILKLGARTEPTTTATPAPEPVSRVDERVSTSDAAEVFNTTESLPPPTALPALASAAATAQAAISPIHTPPHPLPTLGQPSTLPIPEPQPPLMKPTPFLSSAPPANGPPPASTASRLMDEPEEDFDGAAFLQWVSRSTKSKRPALQVAPVALPNGSTPLPVPPAPIPHKAAEDNAPRRQTSDLVPTPSVDASGSSLAVQGPSKADEVQTGGALVNNTAAPGASSAEVPQPSSVSAKASHDLPRIAASSAASASIPSPNQLDDHMSSQPPLLSEQARQQTAESEVPRSKEALSSIVRQELPPPLTRFERLALKPSRPRIAAPLSDTTFPSAAPATETSSTPPIQGNSRPKRDRDSGGDSLHDASSQRGAPDPANKTPIRSSIEEDAETRRKRQRLSEPEKLTMQAPAPLVPCPPVVVVKRRLLPTPAADPPSPTPKTDVSPPVPTPPAASVPAAAPAEPIPPASLEPSAARRRPKRRRGSEDTPSEPGSAVSQQTTVAPTASAASSPPAPAGTSSPPASSGTADPAPNAQEAPPEADADASGRPKRIRGVFTERAGQSMEGGRWSLRRK